MYEEIKEIIDKWDPIDLLRVHCPDDEYDYEIKKIGLVYSENISEIDLGEIIYNIFTESFGNAIFDKTKDECNIVAKEITGNLNSKKEK